MLILLLLVLAYFMWTDLTLGKHVSFTDDKQAETAEFDNPQVEMNDDHAIVTQNGETNKLSRRCPHAGCNVNYDKDSNQFVCPCHQSKFNLQGEVLQGPAESNLAPY